MNIKHFIKTLLLFTAMIFFGLLGVYLLGYFDKSGEQTGVTNSVDIKK
jgi:hypothetical protein